MVQRGKLKELIKSGVDFASLLKQPEDDEHADSQPATKVTKERTLSQTSVLSLVSSTQSHKESSIDLPVSKTIHLVTHL